jgi:hypothetical protein
MNNQNVFKNGVVILIVICSLTTTGGCKKSIFKRHAEGKVTDISDGTRVAFAEIAIENERTEIIGNTTKEILATGQANAKGEFEITYKTNYKGTNYVYAQAEHYYFIPGSDRDEIDGGSRKGLEVKLTPKTSVFVTFNITDTNISFVYFAFFPETNPLPQDYNVHQGSSQQYFDILGNSENKYLYIIHYKNAPNATINGTVFCPKWNKPTASVNINL